MNTIFENSPTLKISANLKFLPLVVSFVENSSIGYSFSSEETVALTLASEEIFTYLCKVNQDSQITITCLSKNYLMEIIWIFSKTNFNPRAFNITSKINPNDQSSLEEMGLLIASRITDNFNMYQEESNIVISFSKFRLYQAPNMNEYNPINLKGLKIVTPEKQQVVLLSSIITNEPNSKLFPMFLNSPYLLADMFEQKDIEVKVLVDNNGVVAGGVLWKKAGSETCELFGPFVHSSYNDDNYSGKLTDSCIESIGRENYKGLLCFYPGRNFPYQYFEEIGNYSGRKIYFRELQEDTGIVSWIDDSISSYIKEQYSKLCLPREIIVVPKYLSSNNKYSVISSKVNKKNNSVKMVPLIYGADVLENISDHTKFFIKENFNDIFFEIDLGVSSHSLFVNSLLLNGFTPSFVIPCGGRGDLLIMQNCLQTIEEK